MDLSELFRGISNKMLDDFDLISKQVIHHAKKGEEREEAVKQFLSSYLPKSYTISTGEVVDKKGQTSAQCDVVIFDASNCPLLYSGTNYQIFPCEPVQAVIEVKSTLTKNELIDAANKIKKVKNLERENGILGGIIFAYKSGFTGNCYQRTVKTIEAYTDINSKLEPKEYIDLIVILDTCLIMLWNAAGYCAIPNGEIELRDRHIFTCFAEDGFSNNGSYEEPPILLSFFIHLLELLSNQKSALPEYHDYARPFLGRVLMHYGAANEINKKISRNSY